MLALAASEPASAACKLTTVAVLPITMKGLRPMVSARINGVDARFVADSSSFYSLMSSARAAEFKLSLHAPPRNVRVVGLGGAADVSVARIKEFTLAGIVLHNFDFLVGGTDVEGDAAGLLGQNVLHIADAEYDLANGVIRLIRPQDCRDTTLTYWAVGQPYSEVRIADSSPTDPLTIGTAYINRADTRVLFDTGTGTSVLSIHAAERAGVKPDSPGVTSASVLYGIGRTPVRTWIGYFANFKIGDEEIRNTRLRFGDIGPAKADMLLGVDFFLSHHIYVASSQHKIYFTYNGGPVFNLSVLPHASAGPEIAGAAKAAAPSSAVSAESLAQQGRVEAARGDLEHAIADLTRASELKPDEPEYVYERGLAYVRNKQLARARADFEHTQELRPDDLGALTQLAELNIAARENAEAIANLDAIDRNAPEEANLRLELGLLYARVDRPERAIAQYDSWIAVHKVDVRMVTALSARCRARAVLGTELDRALDDCDAALRLSRKSVAVFDSRGLVRLRQGKPDRAISDYDASLKGQPSNAWSLYGRGLAKLRMGKTAEGQADLAAAAAIDSHIADRFAKIGLSP